MFLMIDNYDSFTYNLVQCLGELDVATEVHRNDRITLDEIEDMEPEAIVISPGPGTPDDAGISLDCIRRFAGRIPIFGVCLGHQCIAQAFGGRIVRARRLMHGKTSEVEHDGRTIFAGVSSPFVATRYHSLAVSTENLPSCLEVSARTAEGEIMALRHRSLPVEGVQFHPESILTNSGLQILFNVVRWARSWRAGLRAS